jgi:small conductance mechanosensitive channel
MLAFPTEAVVNEAVRELAILAPRIGMGLLVFAAFSAGSLLVRSLLLRVARRTDYNTRFILRLAARISFIGLLVFGTITALGTMGVNVSALVAGLGLTGFALGFALKDVLSNLMAGVLIILYRPFRVNDYISVKDHGEGTVTEIDLRYTTLEKEGQKYLLPNSVLFTNSIGLIEGKRRRDVA